MLRASYYALRALTPLAHSGHPIDLFNRLSGLAVPSEAVTKPLPSGLRLRDGLPSSFQFPLDIIAVTIEILQDDLPALRACALTSKEWYRLARPYLYKVINILDIKAIQDFLEIWLMEPEINGWVKEIRVRHEKDVYVPLQTHHNDTNPKPPALDQLPENFPDIRTLNIMINYPGPLYLVDFKSLSSLRTVKLGKVNVYEIDLIMLLIQLPHVMALQLSKTYFPSADVAAMVRPRNYKTVMKKCQTLRLRTFDMTLQEPAFLSYPGENLLLPWLLKSPSCQTLRSVTIGIGETQVPTLSDTAKFLSMLSPSLEELSLKPPRAKYYIVKKPGRHPITLSHLPGLRRLALGDPTHPAVMSILSSPIASVQQIEFDMKFRWSQFHSYDEYKPLEERRCDTAFPSLEGVRINYTGSLRERLVWDVVQQAFPGLYEKGFLRVTMVYKR